VEGSIVHLEAGNTASKPLEVEVYLNREVYRTDRKPHVTKDTGTKHSSTFHLLLLPSSISSFFLSEDTEI
jgi:hypothetical protein